MLQYLSKGRETYVDGHGRLDICLEGRLYDIDVGLNGKATWGVMC